MKENEKRRNIGRIETHSHFQNSFPGLGHIQGCGSHRFFVCHIFLRCEEPHDSNSWPLFASEGRNAAFPAPEPPHPLLWSLWIHIRCALTRWGWAGEPMRSWEGGKKMCLSNKTQLHGSSLCVLPFGCGPSSFILSSLRCFSPEKTNRHQKPRCWLILRFLP